MRMILAAPVLALLGGAAAAQTTPTRDPADVLPGAYTVRLTAAGKTLTQPLQVMMDPRVKTSIADLTAQYNVAKTLYDNTMKATAAIHQITVLRDQLHAAAAPAAKALEGNSQQSKPNPPVTTGESLESNLDKIAGRESGRGGGRGGPAGPPTLASIRTQLVRIEHSIENADFKPTDAQVEAAELVSKPLPELLDQWEKLKQTQLKALNDQRRRAHLPLLTLNTGLLDHDVLDQIEVGDDQ